MREEIAAASAVILPSAGRINVPAATRLRSEAGDHQAAAADDWSVGRPEMKTRQTQYSKFIEPGRKAMHSANTAVRGFQSDSTFPSQHGILRFP